MFLPLGLVLPRGFVHQVFQHGLPFSLVVDGSEGGVGAIEMLERFPFGIVEGKVFGHFVAQQG